MNTLEKPLTGLLIHRARVSLALVATLISTALTHAAGVDEVSFGGTWAAQVPGMGWVVIDYTGHAQGQVGPRQLWWFVETVPITGVVEGTRLRTYYTDQQGRKREGLIFALLENHRLRLEPGGIFPGSLPFPFAGLELQRVGDDQWYNLTNNYYATSQWGQWHSGGELKTLPSDWPVSLAVATARFLSGRVHELARVLQVRTLTPEFLEEAFQWTLEKPRWANQKDWIQRVIAGNPACGRVTLEQLWALPHQPEIWRNTAFNPNAAPDWRSQYPERVLSGSPNDQVLALNDRGMPADLVEDLAQRGSAEALSGVSRHPNATTRALKVVFDRSQNEHGSDPYLWEHLATHPNTPIGVLRELARSAVARNSAQLLAALSASSSCPPEVHRDLAEARFKAVFGTGQPPYNYGTGPLEDPYLSPSHIVEWIDLPVPSVRAAIASNPALTDDQLKLLTADPSELVSRRALENWRKRYPSRSLPTLPSTAGKRSSFRDEAEIRDMIDQGKTGQAAEVWRRLPAGLQASLRQVAYWDKSMGSPALLLDFVMAAEVRGGPLAANTLLIFIREAPEHIAEMNRRGLLQQIAPFPALSQAISIGQSSTVQELLDAGFTPNCVGDGGMTPLRIAVGAGNTEIIKLLLKYGANKRAKDGYSRDVADYARHALRVDAFALLAETPSELQQLRELRDLLTPAPKNSPWVGRWTNRKDGFSVVAIVFDQDGTFTFGASMFGLRGGWQVVEPGRVRATPIWFEDEIPASQKSDLEKLKSTFRELAFLQMENPTRIEFKLAGQDVVLYPENNR